MLGRPAAPFRFWDRHYPIYTHLRHLPGSRLHRLHRTQLDRRGRVLPRPLHDRRVGRRGCAATSGPGPASRDRCCSAMTSTRMATRRPASRSSASAATSCSSASSSTRTHASATAPGSSTSAASSTPMARAITFAAELSSCQRAESLRPGRWFDPGSRSGIRGNGNRWERPNPEPRTRNPEPRIRLSLRGSGSRPVEPRVFYRSHLDRIELVFQRSILADRSQSTPSAP